MRRTRSLSFALVAIVGVALIATGYGVAQLTSVETEVRVVARPHERVEFAVQQRMGGEWGERIAPSSRYLTPRLIEERVGRWLNSSPITLTVAVESDEITETTDEGQAEPASSPNRPPIANAGPDGSHDLYAKLVVLDGSNSRDPDGDSLAYEWTQIGGPTVALRNPASAEASFESPRTQHQLTFQLRVTDGLGASDTDTLVVMFVNTPPSAEAGPDKQIGRGEAVTLIGAGFDDASENSLTYTWSQTSGPSVELSDAATATPSFTAPNEVGTLIFSLTVSDGEYESEPDTATITVRNTQPVADAGPRQEVSRGERVTLDGRASADPNGDRLTYRWTQTSGDEVRLSNPATPRPSFTAPQTGQVLIFQLEVSDGQLSATDTVLVNVTYDPVVASNFGTATLRTLVLYEAKEDAFTGNVRTDVRMRGPAGDLLLDVVCFENGTAAIGFWLLEFVRPERDADFPQELEVIWRLDTGTVHRETLDVEFLGERPAVYFQGYEFEDAWPQVLDGGSLAVRIGYRGVQEDVFDLDAFAETPVHGNLVNCGSY